MDHYLPSLGNLFYSSAPLTGLEGNVAESRTCSCERLGRNQPETADAFSPEQGNLVVMLLIFPLC